MTQFSERSIPPTISSSLEDRNLKVKRVAFSTDKPNGALTMLERSLSEETSENPRKLVSKLLGLKEESLKNLKAATGLSDQELSDRYQEFHTNFPSGVMTYREFKELSGQILDPTEVESFCRNVFRMFDSNNDGALTFDEFTIATSAKETSTIDEKLTWLFEAAFDKNRSGKIMKSDVHDILFSLLQMENVPNVDIADLVANVFRDLDLNQDGTINKREFILATSQSAMLNKILANNKKKVAKEPDSSKLPIAPPDLQGDKLLKTKRRKAPKHKITYDPTKRRPSREMEIYGMGVQSLLVQSQSSFAKSSSKSAK